MEIAGAGDMGTTREPPVDADGSTTAGLVTFSESVDTRTGADSVTSVTPVTHVHVTCSWKTEPKEPETPSCVNVAELPVVDADVVPTSATAGELPTATAAAMHGIE